MKLIDAFTPAWDRMEKFLFRPFDLNRWFALGFSAWLASFLTGGAQGNINMPGNFDKGEIPRWLIDNWIPIACASAVIIIAFAVLLTWLGCRGRFMLVDNVVRETDLVREPWRKFRGPANSLFRFYLLFYAISLAFLIILGGAAYAYYAMVPHSRSLWYFAPYLIPLLIFIVQVVVCALALFYVREFGVLWMYRNGGSAWDAARKVLALATAQPVDFILYLLIRIVMAFVFSIIAMFAGCLTCCIGFLPYLSSVLTLPLSVFRTRYTIECFAQLGPDCDVRPAVTPPPLAI